MVSEPRIKVRWANITAQSKEIQGRIKSTASYLSCHKSTEITSTWTTVMLKLTADFQSDCILQQAHTEPRLSYFPAIHWSESMGVFSSNKLSWRGTHQVICHPMQGQCLWRVEMTLIILTYSLLLTLQLTLKRGCHQQFFIACGGRNWYKAFNICRLKIYIVIHDVFRQYKCKTSKPCIAE